MIAAYTSTEIVTMIGAVGSLVGVIVTGVIAVIAAWRSSARDATTQHQNTVLQESVDTGNALASGEISDKLLTAMIEDKPAATRTREDIEHLVAMTAQAEAKAQKDVKG